MLTAEEMLTIITFQQVIRILQADRRVKVGSVKVPREGRGL